MQSIIDKFEKQDFFFSLLQPLFFKMTYHNVITKLQLFVHIVIHTQYLLEVTFPLQNYDT